MSSDDAVRTADVSRDPAAPVRIFVRPVGSALPLGIMSFSVGMLLLAALDDGWVAATQGKQVGLLLVAFVFPLELLASVFAFLARDTLGGTVLAFFAGSWVALGLVQLLSAPGTLSPAVGFYLLVFAAAAFLLAGAGALGKPLISVLLALSAARAVLSRLHELGHGAGSSTRPDSWPRPSAGSVSMPGSRSCSRICAARRAPRAAARRRARLVRGGPERAAPPRRRRGRRARTTLTDRTALDPCAAFAANLRADGPRQRLWLPRPALQWPTRPRNTRWRCAPRRT